MMIISISTKLFFNLLTVLVTCQLVNCIHRRHHRRSISFDNRWLGFHWEVEPSSVISDNFQLRCQFSTDTKNIKEVRTEWRKDGATILTSKHITVHSNQSLSGTGISQSDEGTYQCVIHITAHDGSQWTFLSRKAQIRIPFLWRFDSQPTDRTVAPGHSTSFHCLVDGRPAPSVKWYHNDRVIKGNGDFTILPLVNSLEIGKILPKHEGEYKCTVELAGKVRTSQTARLTVDATVDSSDIVVASEPRFQAVMEGDPAVLECLAGGLGSNITWLKDGAAISQSVDHIKNVGISSLYFNRTLSSDNGLYTCRISKDGDVVDRTVSFQVNVPPSIVVKPVDRIAIETTDVELECSASGKPSPIISWYKNGEALVQSDYFVMEKNKLMILGLVKTDQGVYQCLAENDSGSAQAAVQLLVDSAEILYPFLRELRLIDPTDNMSGDDSSSVAAASGLPLLTSAPLGLKVSLVGARAVGLEWDAPLQRHGRILYYHVFYKEEGSDRERSANTTATSLTITGLQPETLFILRVSAENEAGVGRSSDHIKVTTKREQAVPGRVMNLEANPLGSETIEVRWSPPPTNGPNAIRYKLFYIRQPAGTEKETQILVSSTAYTLHGMDKFTEYAIRVEAEGDNGAGLSSDILKVRTLSDVPSVPPKDVIAEPSSSTSVRVLWSLPDLNMVHGEILGFRLKYKTRQRGGKGNTFAIDNANEKEYTIGGLEPNMQYLVRMAVVNQNGTGPYTDWMRVDTPDKDKEEALLGAPREIKPVAANDYIVVHWLPPSDESVLVRGYQIGWGQMVPDIHSAQVGASVLQYKISGLQPGKEYVVSVRGVNSISAGYPIYETVRTLSRAQVPLGFDTVTESDENVETPVAVRAEAISATAMRITWTDPDENAFNTQYAVRYSTGIDGNQIRYVNTSEPYVTVDSLRPDTIYEFSVRAISPHGGSASQWSMAARNRTDPSAPSSAPRDVTLSLPKSGDPHQVIISWQPPKYANGNIKDYLIYFSDRASAPDKDWSIAYVPGDRLQHTIKNLLPKVPYYFKIQATNDKGYGPLSATSEWRSGSAGSPSSSQTEQDGQGQIEEMIRMLTSNPLYMAVVGAFAVLVLLSVILIIVCVLKRSSKNKRGPSTYSAAKQTSNQPGDLWINHPGGSHVRGAISDLMVGERMGASLADMKHLHGAEAVDSPPPRYQTLQDGPYGSVAAGRPRRTPLRQSVSSYDDRGSDSRRPLIGRAKPIPASNYAVSDADSAGTLSRSYHQSNSSLEQQRQRTPQVVYTGNGRHQPIAKIEMDSPYGSSSQLEAPTPPLPMGGPPQIPPIHDGYRTLRGQTSQSGNPLRSFTSLSGAVPPTGTVRPVVIAAGGKQLPVGRATAQPRVNVASIYGPYASCSHISTEEEKKLAQQADEQEASDEQTPLQPSNSTEELNAQMENLDTMIDDLQALQHEFGVAS